jgi:hypothetical protein
MSMLLDHAAIDFMASLLQRVIAAPPASIVSDHECSVSQAHDEFSTHAMNATQSFKVPTQRTSVIAAPGSGGSIT